jgi:hypothetical protein
MNPPDQPTLAPTPRTDAMLNECEWGNRWFRAHTILCRMLERELTAEREKVRVLREALENLRDDQDGVPLYTREEQWKQAMDGADAALAATEESK